MPAPQCPRNRAERNEQRRSKLEDKMGVHPFCDDNKRVLGYKIGTDDWVEEKADVVREMRKLMKTVSEHDDEEDQEAERRYCAHNVNAVHASIARLALEERLKREEVNMRDEFQDLFQSRLPHIDEVPDNVYHRFKLKDPDMVIAKRQYGCPQKYKAAWKSLLDEHLEAGRIRHSSSPYASPSFVTPKSDPAALPRWVNDYRTLNDNTIPDRHPLPTVDDILRDCRKGKIFGKIDMTNAFFQTRVHPEDIPYTAVTTPWGLYEWVVMPQGCRNAPATHQRRMIAALRDHIGRICQVYIDDIIIWSDTVEEHVRNVRTVLECLRKAKLVVSPKKTQLFALELDFLGHHIAAEGITPQTSKVDKIAKWPVPKSASDVRSFLGMVRFLDKFLPHLADHTHILTPLTAKEIDHSWPGWLPEHQVAFQAIKDLVTSAEALASINYEDMGDNRIFVCTDASDWRTGAVLLYGTDRESAKPVAYDSMQLTPTEMRYPVHEKELLAVVRALRKWRSELLGMDFTVYTDHRTLEYFMSQRDLSRRQARWQEFLGQYAFNIVYLPGELNVVADALSRLPEEGPHMDVAQVGTLEIGSEANWLASIKEGYAIDPWCKKLPSLVGTAGIEANNGLFYVAGRLVVPRHMQLREQLYRVAHDSMGHFGFEKTYELLRPSYYWPHMRTDLEKLYVPSCMECQRAKGETRKPAGPLHPLPIPAARGDAIAMDFVGPLPEDDGFDGILTITDRLGADIRVVPIRMDMTAEDVAEVFFDQWYCENGLPLSIVSDRDKLFMSRFWKSLHHISGIRLTPSTAYHPQTDGSSERTNKTVVQLLRYHVTRQQKGWKRALPRIRFHIMNTVNASTGFAPFQLHLGRRPRVLPPLWNTLTSAAVEKFGDDATRAATLLKQMETDTMEASDNLVLAKLKQAEQANKNRGEERAYSVGDKVLLSTLHRRRDYMQRGDHRVAKFMVRFDGPYTITAAYPTSSTYTLDLPAEKRIYPTFHSSLLRPYVPNDPAKFPGRDPPQPGPVVTVDGQDEWMVEKLVDRKRCGRGWRFLVRWVGYGPESDSWIPGSEALELSAYDDWLKENDPDEFAREQALDT